MVVPLRRFRTTGATAILRTARRAGGGSGIWPSLIAAAVVCHLVCLARCAAAASPVDMPTGRLLAAGEAAAERGWYLAARDHWQNAAREAERSGDAAMVEHVAARTARLDAVEREIDAARTARRRAADAAWSAADWTVSWRAAGIPTACGVGPENPPLSIADGLVVWNTGRSIHGVGIADGRPRWRTADDRDSCLFPRRIAGLSNGPSPACSLPPTAATCVGGRAYGVIDEGRDGHLLVCLDLSDAAEGRLAWAAAPANVASWESAAAKTATFDGPPAVDHEFCAVVLRGDDARGSLALAVFDARDGGLRWVRSLGPAVGIDGVDRGRGRRQPCLAEDRILIDTHAGRVHAFDRDGAASWTLATPPAAGLRDDTTSVSPVLFAQGRGIVVAIAGAEITAVDPRRGEPIWRWQAGDSPVASVLGTSAGGLVIATRTHGSGPTTLRRLSIATGEQTAESLAGDQEDWSAGQGIVAAGTVFWPVRGRRAAADGQQGSRGLQVEVLDSVTLQRRRPPLDCGPAADEFPARPSGPRLAVANGSLVIADATITCRRPASAAASGPVADPSSR